MTCTVFFLSVKFKSDMNYFFEICRSHSGAGGATQVQVPYPSPYNVTCYSPHAPLQHQASDGSSRNVTPPLSIQQGRPLPALPVSPPPQLPPREAARGKNWPGRTPATNLDDDWENSSNDSNDVQRRRQQHDAMSDLSDAVANFRPCNVSFFPFSLFIDYIRECFFLF